MVKLTGPGTAQKASGTLSAALIFSHTKRGAYLKRHRKPKQPKTNPQLSMQAMWAFLSNAWARGPAASDGNWDELAEQRGISPFNAYMAVNSERHRSGKAPTIYYPAPETLASETGFVLTTAVHKNVIRISWTYATLTNAWLTPIYTRILTETIGAWHLLRAAVYNVLAGDYFWDDVNPVVGVNRYSISLMSQTGLRSTWFYNRNVTFP